ncbi:hypothetical protein EPA93_30430 [Ktedonosporobacter rubrisoli]|uniref:beta-N-acetylhexosaminidase n=1 Tax=Ktedonosporobacter rubrisoli TaxID=2509675 RepID=A0A4P6JWI9_KTERU|nr:glycoside hydrolase family 3 N-terminal domain-containing protein [Ktedonosporobacter rubrisoli]QBD80068.1 hypothetical protein EPA93_30430 [Ktedonosporobacter rubrisoli]
MTIDKPEPPHKGNNNPKITMTDPSLSSASARRPDAATSRQPSIQQFSPVTPDPNFPENVTGKHEAWMATSRPMPAQEYQKGNWRNLELSAKLARVKPSARPQTTRRASFQAQLGLMMRRRQRRSPFIVVVSLVLLVALVLISGLIGERVLSGTAFLDSGAALLNLVTNHKGPAVQQPLNAQQISARRHLAMRMNYKQLAGLYVSRMTLDEKLGQLIMVEYNDSFYSPDLDTMVNQLHAGGVIMYEFQMQTADQTRQDIAKMQKNAKLPLFVSTDEEGGIVQRLRNIYPSRPSALSIYESGNQDMAAQQGHQLAHDLLALGINTNLAPDVDVALVPNGPNQVTRTFGYSADSVIKFAGPYMQALQGDGVIACIKHFPGLGASTIDAHFGLPVINRTKEQIYQVELAPFKHFIQSPDKLENPGMIMPTDVLMPAIDPKLPAELSPTFMTDILRKEFGYDGVVLTDALYMQGVVVDGKQISMPQAAVLALKAGDDMILGPSGSDQMHAMLDALKAAVQDGTLTQARIDEAATRIIALKMQSHLMPAVAPQL